MSLDYGNLKIDDTNQIIQDVHIADKEIFQQIRFVVVNNHLEGWMPTSNDVKHLMDEAQNTHSELNKEYDKIFGEKNDRLDPRHFISEWHVN